MIFRQALVALGMLVLAGGLTPVAGQSNPSPDALQAAKELSSMVSRNTMAELMNTINNQMWPTLEAEARRNNPGIDDATLGELRQALERIQMAFVQDVMNEAPTIYARHFTAQEMRDITAFYRTPAGAKALTTLPKLTSELMGGLAPRLQSLGRELEASFSEILQRRGFRKK